MTVLTPPAERTDPRWRSHTAVLAFGTFVVGTDAFVIAGIIPDIARSLEIGVGAAGQLVTVFALAYAVLAPVLAALTASWSRRTVLVAALAVFALGNAVTAVAPGYGPVLASRVIAAAGAALYTATASAAAAGLAGEQRRGRAIAIVIMGLTSALALGAPLGTAVGSALGWRATMWAVTALSLTVLPVIAVRLPAIGQPQAGLRQRLAPLADRGVQQILAITVVAFVGIYIPYTYISAVFEPAIAGHGGRLAVVLLVFGMAGTAGNLAAGYLADRCGPRRVIITGMLALTVVFLALPAFRDSYAAVLPATAVTGFFSFTVTTPQQHQLIALAPNAKSMATSLYQSVLYLAISLSGAAGALGLDILGPAALPPLAAPFALATAGLTWLTGRPTYPPHRLGRHQAGRLGSWPKA